MPMWDQNSQYLGRLADGLGENKITAPLRIMGSNGGTWSAAAMSAEPVNAMLSGPAGGVTASLGIAKLLNLPNIITYDMGGTSTDACLIRNYEYNMTTEGHVGMWPNRAPQIEIKTVGAGGGSIAYLDPGKFLNVGPRSTGAAPGPACYGKGGTEPTVTDANVVLGRFRLTWRLVAKLSWMKMRQCAPFRPWAMNSDSRRSAQQKASFASQWPG